jgi:hypothetical protein
MVGHPHQLVTLTLRPSFVLPSSFLRPSFVLPSSFLRPSFVLPSSFLRPNHHRCTRGSQGRPPIPAHPPTKPHTGAHSPRGPRPARWPRQRATLRAAAPAPGRAPAPSRARTAGRRGSPPARATGDAASTSGVRMRASRATFLLLKPTPWQSQLLAALWPGCPGRPWPQLGPTGTPAPALGDSGTQHRGTSPGLRPGEPLPHHARAQGALSWLFVRAAGFAISTQPRPRHSTGGPNTALHGWVCVFRGRIGTDYGEAPATPMPHLQHQAQAWSS